jgi:hypothetical protein
MEDPNKSIALSEWYPEKLGVRGTQMDVDLTLQVCDNPYGHLRASLAHPQISVRLSVELGLLGAALGVVSLLR